MNIFVPATNAKRANAGKVSGSVLELIGNTPIFEFKEISKNSLKNKLRVFAKVEFSNPSGSIKDRMISYAIEAAEKRGELKKGSTIVEATSGNTGVALSMIASVKGYKTIIVMPNSTSEEKIKMMRAFGAKLVFTEEDKGMAEPVRRAKEIAEKWNYFFLNQFENPDNVRSQIKTGEEILESVGEVDVFVAGIGTGGTLIGVGRALRERNEKTKIVAVEPAKVPAFYNMFYGKDKKVAKGIAHKIEGIGEGFVPPIVEKNKDMIDEVILVEDKDAIKMMDKLSKKEGLFGGFSSGANLWAAFQVAQSMDKGKIVTVIPDTAQRYLCGEAFDGRKENDVFKNQGGK